jgi:outer membrane protein assembly factor BamB
MKLVRFSIVAALIMGALASVGCTGTPPPQGFSGVVTDGESLYIGSADGRIVVLDPDARATGEPFPSASEWDYAITTESKGTFGCGTSQNPSVLYGSPVLNDGYVSIGTYDGKVLMMQAEARATGQSFPQVRAGEWLFPRTEDKIGPVVGGVAIDGDSVFISSSVKDGSRTLGVVYALDRLFGDELWVSEPLDGKLWVTPAVVDGVVYVSTFDGRIYSLDGATGATLPWMFQGEFGFVSSPFAADGMLYVGDFDRTLTAVALGATEPAWTFQADNWFWAAPVVSNGVIFAASLDGKLYALDALTGAPAWSTPYDAGESVAASPVLAGDSVVVVTKKGDVHVINSQTGMGARVPNPANATATTCNAEVIASPCFLDGTVYVRAQNNSLYAIDPATRTIRYTFSLKTE